MRRWGRQMNDAIAIPTIDSFATIATVAEDVGRLADAARARIPTIDSFATIATVAGDAGRLADANDVGGVGDVGDGDD